MLKRVVGAAFVACFLAGTIGAATDPFVGTWKLEVSRSRLAGQLLKIQYHGSKKYTVTSGNLSYTMVADGKDHPELFGLTQSITLHGPNAWTRVVKKNGRVVRTAVDTVSPDGKTFTEEVTSRQPDGSTDTERIVAKRVAGHNGLAGTWETTGGQVGPHQEILIIRSYQDDGLSFIDPAEHTVQHMKFDGRNYPETGPGVPVGSVSSGRRVDSRTLKITDKIQGQLMDTMVEKVSPDGQTLTMTVDPVGQSKPLVLVFERQHP